jgi:Fe-S cluster assembly protein SufB
LKKPLPTWPSADLSEIDFDNIFYYLRPTDNSAEKNWDDVPPYIKDTFDKLGIPEAERKFLAGVSAQYESEVVYHSIQADLEKQGVVFLDMDSGLRKYPEVVKEYFATVIPAADNKFAALNSAAWSGGSFIYVPKGVHVEMPLQAYFRINAQNMGQFERTLIIADEGSRVHYIEGCTAPTYSSDSLHSAVVELIASPARIFVIRPFRTGRTTCTTWSPSARSHMKAPLWSGWTEIWARK